MWDLGAESLQSLGSGSRPPNLGGIWELATPDNQMKATIFPPQHVNVRLRSPLLNILMILNVCAYLQVKLERKMAKGDCADDEDEPELKIIPRL